MEGITISVVIPAFNEEETIAKCLRSLAKQKTKHSFEVIVVNNNSTDKTVKIAESFKGLLNLRTIKESKKGRGSARARGFDVARGDIIFTTDADSIIPSNWISTFMRCFADDNVVAVTGVGKITDNTWISNELFNFFHPWTMHVYKFVRQHYWLNGFSYAIRREVYFAAGEIDTTLNAMDDLDLSLRVVKFGKIQVVKKSRVITSGRRFRGNFFMGVASYCKPMFQVAYQRKRSFYMDDVR